MAADRQAKAISVALEWVEKAEKLLDKNTFVSKILDTLKQKTGLKRSYFVSGLLLIVLIIFAQLLHCAWHFIGGLNGILELVTRSVIIVYPVIRSLEVLQAVDQKETRKWLTFWSCFAIFYYIELTLSPIRSFFDSYYLLKTVIVCALMPNQKFNGSELLYEHVVQPTFLRARPHISKSLMAVKVALDGSAKTAEPEAEAEAENEGKKHQE